MRSLLVTAVVSFCLALLCMTGCEDDTPTGAVDQAGPKEVTTNYVTVADGGSHYEIVIDYTTGATPAQIGAEMAHRIKQALPEFEELMDAYLASTAGDYYAFLIMRARDFVPRLPEPYRQELEGAAGQCSGGTTNAAGDGKLSRDELFLLNLIPDALRGTQCSGVAVFGSRSETQSTIVGRNLDWPDPEDYLARFHAVTTIRKGDASVCLIGFVGFMGMLTGFNDDGVFAGILDAGTGATYSSEGKSSYAMDLRHALETYTTAGEVGEYMTDGSRSYAYNHLILLADASCGMVVENNFSSPGSSLTTMSRALRTHDSRLRAGVDWDIDNAVGVVNSFVLEGNHDNHSSSTSNTARWESMVRELSAQGETVSVAELEEVIAYDGGDGPGRQSAGDLYCDMMIQTVVFQPASLTLRAAFKPASGGLPSDPAFETVAVSFE